VSESLAHTVGLYAAGLTLLLALAAARGRGLGRAQAGAAIVLGAGAALDALLALGGLVAGERPAEAIPFAGYLLLSTLVVPAGWAYSRSSSAGWDSATFAVATGTLFVICLRLERTWG
jgi:hypothetical protein